MTSTLPPRDRSPAGLVRPEDREPGILSPDGSGFKDGAPGRTVPNVAGGPLYRPSGSGYVVGMVHDPSPTTCPQCDGPVPDGAADCPVCGMPAAEGTAIVGIPSEAGPTSAPAPGSAAGSDALLEPLAPGTSIGRFQLLSRLGSGAMGTVWKAIDPSLGRPVALKLLHPELSGDPSLSARFVREGRAAARLHHPGVVTVHDAGEIHGRLFLALEFVEGRTLEFVLEETRAARASAHASGLRRLREDVGILAEMAEAVAHAHDHGVIHRDLKPGNVLVDAGERPHIADFGLVRDLGADVVTRLTATGHVMGTPAYLSPEQAAGDPYGITPATDVWSLGAILYETLTGRTPFAGAANFTLLLEAIRHQDPPRPRVLFPALPAELEAICLRALEKDFRKRYPTAREFAEDLRRWLAGIPVAAAPASPANRAIRRLARHRGALLALGICLSLGAVAVAMAHAARRHAREQARALQREIARSVAGFEDAIGREALSDEARALLARQPLALIDAVHRGEPGFGAARAWRGLVLARMGRDAEAEAEFDHACADAPESAIVWYLRGEYRADRYAARGAPEIISRASDVRVEPAPPDSPEEQTWRSGALADFARMEGCVDVDEQVDLPRRNVARARIAQLRGTAEGFEEALSRLEGTDTPAAHVVRGRASIFLHRFTEAVEAYDRALAVWPAHPAARRERTFARLGQALRLRHAGEDARPPLQAALEDWEYLRRAGQYRPGRDTYSEALCRLELGVTLRGLGEDGRAVMQQAVDLLESESPSPRWETRHQDLLGGALSLLGEAAGKRGEDPRPFYARAIEVQNRILAASPSVVANLVARGHAWYEIGVETNRRRGDPEDSFRRARNDFEEALRLGFRDGSMDRRVGLAVIHESERLRSRGDDPAPTLAHALELFTRSLAANPGSSQDAHWRGFAWMRLAEDAAARGEDPREPYRRAMADHDRCLQGNPACVESRTHLGLILHRMADLETALGADPRPSLERSVRELDQALTLDPSSLEARSFRAGARHALAEARWERGGEVDALLDAAIDDCGRILASAPGHAFARHLRGACRVARGIAFAARGRDPSADWTLAEQDLRRSIGAGLPMGWLQLGRLFESQGRGNDAIAAYAELGRAFPNFGSWVKTRIDRIRAGEDGKEPK